jgi:hypothetical protein
VPAGKLLLDPGSLRLESRVIPRLAQRRRGSIATCATRLSSRGLPALCSKLKSEVASAIVASASPARCTCSSSANRFGSSNMLRRLARISCGVNQGDILDLALQLP